MPEVFDPNSLPMISRYKQLTGHLCIPSAVHGYSVAVEYMKNWFLQKFHTDYFKTVYINGKHIMDDYRRFSIFSNIKRANPAVSITPIVNYEYDRDGLDAYMGDTNLLINKFNFRESFFKDYEHNIFLGFNIREIEMNFTYKIRVESKAQQIDLFRYMEAAFRIGYTSNEFISVDYHIPNEMIQNIAIHAGFETNENGEVLEINKFLLYLNQHSGFPIVYKMRAVNGKCEYFVRVKRVYAYTDTRQKLSLDDGEMNGKLNKDYIIEMNVLLHLWVPHYYVYLDQKEAVRNIPLQDSNVFGLFTLKLFDPPLTDKHGWDQYLITEYELDYNDIKKDYVDVDIEELFGGEFKAMIQDHINKGISPSIFINIVLYNMEEDAAKTIDWETYTMRVPNPKTSLHIAVYVDMLYFNAQQALIHTMNRDRLS